MKKVLLLVPVCLLFFCSFAHASTDHLWLNQIQTTGGPGKTTNDFVEIYNPTTADVDLNGMRLVKRSVSGTTDTLLKSWTSSTIVSAGGYYLWANSAYTDIAVTPDVTTSGSISDDNGIALRLGANDTGTIIDSVAWGNSANAFIEGSVFATNPSANQALIRSQDTDDNSSDFTLGTPNPQKSLYVAPVIPPTDTPNPPPPPPADPVTDPTPPPPPPASTGGGSAPVQYSSSVIISEFLPNPDGADSGAEWVELYNTSTNDVDLSGWFLDDEGTPGTVGSSAYVFSASSIINAKSFKVIELPDGVFALDNTGGDALRLIWPNKVAAQQVTYTDAAPTDVSYARKADGTYAWTTATTKGAANQFVAPTAAASTDTKSTTETQADPTANAAATNRPIILISELFPDPDRNSDQDEYIELYNPLDKDTDLAGLKIADLATSYKLTGIIPANGYFVINKSDSNIALNNSGNETVTLTDAAGDVIYKVSYTDAPTDQSYNLMPDGSFRWSTDLTPGAENKITTGHAAVTSSSTAKVSTKSNSVNDNSVVEASATLDPLPPGEIAGANVSQTSPTSAPANFWPWLAASFAANLLFSYGLVRFMSKGRSE